MTLVFSRLAVLLRLLPSGAKISQVGDTCIQIGCTGPLDCILDGRDCTHLESCRLAVVWLLTLQPCFPHVLNEGYGTCRGVLWVIGGNVCKVLCTMYAVY